MESCHTKWVSRKISPLRTCQNVRPRNSSRWGRRWCKYSQNRTCIEVRCGSKFRLHSILNRCPKTYVFGSRDNLRGNFLTLPLFGHVSSRMSNEIHEFWSWTTILSDVLYRSFLGIETSSPSPSPLLTDRYLTLNLVGLGRGRENTEPTFSLYGRSKTTFEEETGSQVRTWPLEEVVRDMDTTCGGHPG